MLERCRERAEREGLPPPRLFAQAMHELDLPRRYRTIILCGGFGLGGRREHDVEGLRRLYAHLEPGGTLVLDNEVPYAQAYSWKYWLKGERKELPRPWGDKRDRRTAADGTELELRSRIVNVDPLAQRVTLEIRAGMLEDGELVAEEEHTIVMTFYFTHEIVLMLERAGFGTIEAPGRLRAPGPSGDDRLRRVPGEGDRARAAEASAAVEHSGQCGDPPGRPCRSAPAPTCAASAAR
jgi:hypothetical protein